jgi:hypothetical protein
VIDYGKKLAAVGFLAFLALWAGGVLRSFALAEPERPTISAPAFFSGEDYRSNRAQASNLAQIGFAKAPLAQVLDQEDVRKIQVYEKTAQITSGTTAFADDEGRIRRAVAAQNARVFSEKASGITPERSLALGISVHPDRFDALLHDLTAVGQLGSINVQQQDRTGEFRRLNAQRQSLKKHQEAILKLRGAGKLTVEEALKLEQKIMEVEKDIQAVGAQLGDLLGKEPSYNLFVTLQESPPGGRLDRGFTLARRFGGGFLWALGCWLVAALGMGLLVATYLSVRTLRTVPIRAGGATVAPPG